MGLRICIAAALGASLLPCLVYAQTYSKTEAIEYSDNLTSWVLGQVRRTTTNGTEVSRTDYDTTTALPVATYSFGKLQQSMTYNADGTMASVKDGNGNVTRLSNYKLGIPQLIQFPATTDQPSGTSLSAVVNDMGEIQSVVDQRGAKTCYSYDAMGRVTRVQYPSETTLGQCGGSWNDTVSSFTSGYPAAYGLPAGLWRQRVATGNAVTETFFDALWRPVVKQTYDTDNENATLTQVVTRYDANGNVVFQSYPQRTLDASITNTWGDLSKAPSALGTTTTYDALNRVTSASQDAESGVSVKTTTRYLAGFQAQTTDPDQKVTTTAFMTYDQPSTDWPVSVAAPEGVTQTISRDAFGSPVAIAQGGFTKTFVYDGNHRLCRTHEPESGDTVMDYDDANNLAWSVSGLTITGSASSCGTSQVADTAKTVFGYDALNRLMTIKPPADTQSTSYTYSPTGAVAWASSGSAIWENHYNYRGLLTSETLHMVGTDARVMSYGYDTNAHVSHVIYPGADPDSAGESVAYAPDALGRPTQAVSPTSPYVSGVQYFPNGQVSQFSYGSGAGYVADQNARQLLSDFTYGTGAALQVSEAEGYDSNGNILTVTDLLNGARNKAFHYDGLNRLKDATSNLWGGTESYTYDALNNITTRGLAGQLATYHYDPVSNLLTSITQTGAAARTFGYDLQGNQTQRNGATLQFDHKNQLLAVVNQGTYRYDASGRRVEKTPSGGNASTSTFPFYNHAGQLLYQYEPAQGKATNYIYLGTRMIARHEHVVLAQPGAITFDSNPNDGNFTVSWGVVPQATSYTLQEQASGGAWATVYSGSAPSASLTGRAGGSYVYQARGCIGTTCGDWTGSATLGVWPATPTNLAGPASLTYAPFTLTWTASPGYASYTIQQSFNGGPWTTLATGVASPSYSVTTAPGGSYTYRVMASNLHGGSGWIVSAPISVTQVPASPTNFSVSTSGINTVLSWDAMTWATSYQLTVTGSNGNLGTYIYTVGTNSFGFAKGQYKAQQLRACSMAGCSAPLQINSVPFTVGGAGNTGYTATSARRLSAYSSSASSGCTAAICAAVLGDQP